MLQVPPKVAQARQFMRSSRLNPFADVAGINLPHRTDVRQPHLLRNDNVMSRHIPSWHGASCDRVSYHVKPWRYHLDEVCPPPLCSCVLDMRDTDRFRKSEAIDPPI